MQCFTGKTVCQGMAAGPAWVTVWGQPQVKRQEVNNADWEINRVLLAKRRTLEQLEQQKALLAKQGRMEGVQILDAHKALADDHILLDTICDQIRNQGVNAEYATLQSCDRLTEMFGHMEDAYLKERAADLKDVCDRLLRNLLSGSVNAAIREEFAEISAETVKAPMVPTEPVIIFADDLTPSQTLGMDKEKVLAFVLVNGSANSHTAILARMMNIPAVIGTGLDLDSIQNGSMVVVDAIPEQEDDSDSRGRVLIDPDPATLEAADRKIQRALEQQKLFAELKGKENMTADGRKMEILANVGNVGDIEHAIYNDAGGIGLLRSEFLYLGREMGPTEEEQFLAYKEAVEKMPGKKTVIRTLDIGADKQVPYLDLGDEPNPAMGFRAIRICLKHPEIFKPQLKALLRAAVYGDLQILYPMITSIREMEWIGQILEESWKELEEQGVPYRIPPQGVMIETPAAVMISEELAGMVDFFSIGTNDLSQYALAIDRQNERLEDFYRPDHEAVMKMICMVVENAHKQGIRAAICGELASNTALTRRFLDMGVDELSVVPSMILKVRKTIREL